MSDYRNAAQDLCNFIRHTFNQHDLIPLHAPVFAGNERQYVLDTLDSTFVSSVGAYVDRLESAIAKFTGARYAIATVNGTSALHMALLVAGVEARDEVITQSLSFVASANAIRYCQASPIFLDVDKDTLGLSPDALEDWLGKHAELSDGHCFNRFTRARIRACLPVHILGHPCRVAEIKAVCERWHIAVVEDASEALGSYMKGKHAGTTGLLGVLSFNGNKIITAGGGGMILTNDSALAARARHLTTTAKVPHSTELMHDEVGYNYRMPNLNAALALAQLEQLPDYLVDKRDLASRYHDYLSGSPFQPVKEPQDSIANYWLNAVIAPDQQARNELLDVALENHIQVRPMWKLLSDLPMYETYPKGDLMVSRDLVERLLCLPSSVRLQGTAV